MRKVRVYHAYYGCDTGCCGHIIEIEGAMRHRFDFSHKDEEGSVLEYAKNLVESNFGKDHCQDLDWENAELEDVQSYSGCGN